MDIKLTIQLLSGLALFLYGMNVMSDNLEKVAGNKMKKIVEMFTSNPLRAIFVGALVTAIIQSSSATTVMTIGFVNAGIMNLYQAVGIIMGANIGTTITGQMISFKLSALAPYAIIIGGFGLLIMNKKAQKAHFYIVLGFGLLFFGMDMMSESMSFLRNSPEVANLIKELSSPGVGNTLLGLLIGTAITAVIQSSSAVTAIIVAMAGSGAITIEASFPIVLGANIGTTITAILSSIGANKTAKKAALMHLLFNVIGSLIFIILFIIFRDKSIGLMSALGDDAKRQIANTHTIFNLLNTIMLFPFIKYIIMLVNKMIPGEDKESAVLRLDDRMIETPSFAIQMTKTEIDRMGTITLESYENSVISYVKHDMEAIKNVFSLEKKINQMQRGLSDFMIKLSTSSLTPAQKSYIDNMFNIINDIERIGDHAKNIAEMAEHVTNEKIFTSDMAVEQVQEMAEIVKKSISQSLKALENEDKYLAKKVIKREYKVDEFERSMRKQHIQRLQEGLCQPEAGIIFLDIISNLERIADHATKISLYVNDIEKA
ncbi:MAG: Na/Pi cotransporter family protein [Bacillota bacterium]|nr:Na/Pi cotransporter family protein [Bacillota bacterium]